MKLEQTQEGWWIIEGDTHLGAWIKQNRKLDHDDFLIPLACLNMPEGGTVIDAGAMYGDHSIAYARKVGKDGAVICIEAGADAFVCLSKNAERFESNMVLINAALGEEHGGKALHSVTEGNFGMSIVTEDDQKGVVIPTVSIDGLAKDAALDRLDFIKIDCEGWEYKILKGTLGVLRQFKPKLLIEINHGALATQNHCDKDIYDLLLRENYAWQIVQPQCKGGDSMFDILCWPNLIEVPKIVSGMA